MHVQQVRQPLYIALSDGYIQNRYSIKIFNKQNKPQEYALITSGLEHARIDVKPSGRFSVAGGESVTVSARVSVDPELVGDEQEVFLFVLVNRQNEKRIQTKAQIFLPE
jgi:polyferredoxin